MTCFIDNEFYPGQGKEFSSIAPASQEVIWQGKSCSADQVHLAVNSAQKAFETWSKMSIEGRKIYLDKYVDLLEKNQDMLASLMSEEMGKPINEAKTEAKIMIGKYKVALEAYQERTGTKEVEVKDSISRTKHRALGVCAVFGPYNFPGHVANGHILPALIAGNTVVYKPSNFVPKFSDAWLKLFQEAGFPNGVINMVQGEVETGEVLAKHDGIKALFFTGSSKVGKILHKGFAGKLDKVLALELGGNNPLVIDNDYDITAAVELAIQSAFITNGQRCTCARRIIIIDKDAYADKFLEEFAKQTKELKIAEPQAGEYLSCLVTKEQASLVLAKQQEYLDKGAKAILTAQVHSLGPAFITPGIIEITDYDCDEEIFGPLTKIYRVSNLEEAIKLANDTQYGLVSAIATNDKANFDLFYQELNSGLINWNTATTGAMGIAPFGGTGISGNHRPSGYYAADYCSYPVASVLN